MWQIIDISNEYCLSTKNNRLIISKEDVQSTIPYHDIHSIILHGDRMVLSCSVFHGCIDNKIPIVFCNEKHIPSGMFLPFNQNEESAKRFEIQMKASLPIKKQAWKQIIEHKLRAQSYVLEKFGHETAAKDLIVYSKSVRSGDTTNREAVGAHTYFSALFNHKFSRRKDDVINALLDYGYSIIRSSVARAVVGTGLYPGLSVFHSNRLNPYALVDDFIEPLRPIVDMEVIGMIKNGVDELTPSSKRQLIALSNALVKYDGGCCELSFAAQQMMECYLRYLEGATNRIIFPLICGSL